MKITLIQPPKPKYGSEAEKHWELARPFSLFYLASAVEKETTFDVFILDLEKKRYRDVALEECLKDKDSQIFGITATTYTRFEAIKIVKKIREMYPTSCIIAGGVHFSYCAEDTLKHVREIDIVVRGEGEIAIVELAKAINDGKKVKNIDGISYREDNKIVHNPNQKVFEDLDKLPFYENFSWNEYPEYLMGYPEKIAAISIMSSRGCPYNCIFCSKSGLKYRLRNPRKVVDEIELLKDKFKIDAFNFLDLTFTANSRHVKDVCQELINRKTNIKWWCESRANISLDLLDYMKKAGCVSTVIGVESGSPRILSEIHKNISLEQVIEFCKKCIDIGIIVHPYFMYSHPGETEKDVRQTIKFMVKLKEIGARVGGGQPTMIFPGTKIEEIARNKGILPMDFSWATSYESSFNKDLGQIANIPLFVDALDKDMMKKLRKELIFEITVKDVAKDIAKGLREMSFKEVVIRAFQAITTKKKIVKYIFSPKFYYEFLMSMVKK